MNFMLIGKIMSMNQFQIRSQVFPMMMLRKDRKKWNFSAYLQIGANDLVVIPNKKNLLNVETYFQGKRSKKVGNKSDVHIVQ